MNSKNISRAISGLAVAAAAVILLAASAQAASWRGIEPFASKRADVERVLGAPVADRYAENGTLQFNVSGGAVTIFFVTAKFVAAKKLSPSLEGTVLQIVLQHQSAADTPESLNLSGNKDYEHRREGKVEVYTNAKEGVAYTFVDGRLKTTRHFYSSEQFQRIQRGA
ncbi:MAG TPA: hypothetical protein VEY09_02860 [Pyrinomonadaceae bacterium]|nr:hypothetical protein [Pyrinomonadaceae bacterium]